MRKAVRRLALTLVLVSQLANAQNGAIVERERVVFSEAELDTMEKSVPDIRARHAGLEQYEITYMSNGLRVKGYLLVPAAPGEYPCIIFNRGGSAEFGALTHKRVLRLLGRLVDWGYVVAASQYRGVAGGEGADEFGGAELNDVLSLVDVLAAEPKADTSRIGMFGWSRGGMMTYRALAETNRFKAAVVGAGLANAFTNIASRPEMEKHVFSKLIPGYAENRDAALRARSAVFWADRLSKTTPLLVLHGSADWRVSPAEALEMADALYKAKHPFRFVFFEGGDHALSEHREEVDRLLRDWLDRYVRDDGPLPNLELHGR